MKTNALVLTADKQLFAEFFDYTSIFILGILLLLFASCSKFEDTITDPIIHAQQVSMISTDQPNSIQLILNDMILDNEAYPHGVPSNWDWYKKGAVHRPIPPSGYYCITNWGQFYETVEGNKASNCRVQIKNVKTFFLSRADNKWYQLQQDQPIDGGWYNELQQMASKQVADIQLESEGISATAGNGNCFHFWSANRAYINPEDIAGIFTTCMARLIVSDPLQTDDRANARYILNMGSDWWQNEYSGQNASVGMGRFRYVKTGWQSYNFFSVLNQLNQNPPPLN